MAHVSINGVKERGNELSEQAVGRGSELLQRGNEWKAQLLGRGSDLRERAVEVAERAQEATGRVPRGRWAKLAGSGLALIRSRTKAAQQVNAPKTLTYELLTLISGILGGALAGAVFNRIWRAVSNAEQAPEPTALDHNVRDVLVAGVLQGAVFGLVKAAVGRATAQGYRRFTRNDSKS